MFKSSWLHLSVCCLLLALARQGRPDSPQENEQDANHPYATDLYGDPLPAGAIARAGTVRGRHGQAVTFIAFLPDGKNVLTVSQDQYIRLWDVKTGKENRRFGKPPNPDSEADFFGLPVRLRSALRMAGPFHASLSRDGKLLACAGQDGPLRLWDVETGKEVQQIEGPGFGGGLALAIPGTMGVSNLALSPDGKVVAGTDRDGTIHLWATSTAKEIKQIAKPENQNIPVVIISDWGPLAFSPDGKSIIDTFVEIGNANTSGSLRLWDVETGKKKLEIRDQNKGIGMFQAAFSPDGKILAHSSVEGTIRFLNVDNGQELGRVKDLHVWASMVFSPDGKTLVAQDLGNQSVIAWEVKSGQESRTVVKRSSTRVHSLSGKFNSAMALSSDGKILGLAHDHVLRILDMSTGKDYFPMAGSQAAMSWVSFLPDGQYLVTRSDDGTGQIWETNTGREKRRLRMPLEEDAMVDLTTDGQRYAVGSMMNQISICDAANGKTLHSIYGNNTGFSAFAFSPDGKVLAVREMVNPLIHIYDVETGKEIRRLEGPPGAVAANRGMPSIGLYFSPDGKRLGASIGEKSIGIWSVETGKQVGLFPLPEASPPLALAFSPDNRMLAVATEGDGVMAVEIASKQVRYHLGKKPKAANPLANIGGMIPPGLAMGGAMPIVSSYAHASRNLVFSPDGKVLSHARSDRKTILWETATGREIGQLDGHQGGITSLAFSANGKQLASGGSDTTALVWDLTSLLPHNESLQKRLSEKEFEDHWARLAAADATKAYQSVCLLSAAQDSTVVFLRKHKAHFPPGRATKQLANLIPPHRPGFGLQLRGSICCNRHSCEKLTRSFSNCSSSAADPCVCFREKKWNQRA